MSEGSTLFLITEIDDREREAAHSLGWRDVEDGAGPAFPAGTHYQDEAFANFQAHACDLLAQRTGTATIPWETALTSALATVSSLPLDWYLVGSAALAARGVDIVPGNIDLVTDAKGAYILESARLPHLVQPVVASPGWVAGYFGRSFMDACVEEVNRRRGRRERVRQIETWIGVRDDGQPEG